VQSGANAPGLERGLAGSNPALPAVRKALPMSVV